jgi:hypothetical protein
MVHPALVAGGLDEGDAWFSQEIINPQLKKTCPIVRAEVIPLAQIDDDGLIFLSRLLDDVTGRVERVSGIA